MSKKYSVFSVIRVSQLLRLLRQVANQISNRLNQGRSVEKAKEAIIELGSLYTQSTQSTTESYKGCSSNPKLMEEMEQRVIKEVQGHIMLQKRLCTGLLETFSEGHPVDCMRILDSIEDVTMTNRMWATVLGGNPRMGRYSHLLKEADRSFFKFIGAIARDGFVIVMPPVEGEQ